MTRRRLKARRDRRGRPRNALAKRRQTTLAGRRGEVVIDHGTEELQRQRRLATTRADLPNDLLGVLYGHGVLEGPEYAAGRDLGELVRLVRLGYGLTEASPAGAWRNILTAAHAGGQVSNAAYPGAERARRVLARLRRELGRAIWRAVSDAVDSIWPEDFGRFIVLLRSGLQTLAERLPPMLRRA
jgi:hypothetical protein